MSWSASWLCGFHTLEAGSPVTPQNQGPALPCTPVKMQGPLSQVLQQARDMASSSALMTLSGPALLPAATGKGKRKGEGGSLLHQCHHSRQEAGPSLRHSHPPPPGQLSSNPQNQDQLHPAVQRYRAHSPLLTSGPALLPAIGSKGLGEGHLSFAHLIAQLTSNRPAFPCSLPRTSSTMPSCTSCPTRVNSTVMTR